MWNLKQLKPLCVLCGIVISNEFHSDVVVFVIVSVVRCMSVYVFNDQCVATSVCVRL